MARSCSHSRLSVAKPRHYWRGSEIQLQRKLNLAGCPLEEQRGAGGGDGSSRGVADLRIGVVELGSVQDVEGFRAKLKMLVRFLIEIEFLEQGQVELFDTRSKQNVPPRVPEGIVPWRDKVRRVVPSLDCGIGNGPGSDPVGPLTRAAGIQKAAYHHWR